MHGMRYPVRWKKWHLLVERNVCMALLIIMRIINFDAPQFIIRVTFLKVYYWQPRLFQRNKPTEIIWICLNFLKNKQEIGGKYKTF